MIELRKNMLRDEIYIEVAGCGGTGNFNVNLIPQHVFSDGGTQMIELRKNMLRDEIYIEVAGCGGTGSQVVSGLYRIHKALLACGHPFGLRVCVSDPDIVTSANIGRQLFYENDIGKNKAEVLVTRYNYAYGVNFRFRKMEFEQYRNTDFMIVCVDSRKARRSIYSHFSCVYMIDCGNGADYGQVAIGTPELPIAKLLPDLVADKPEEEGPSCSLADAVRKQDLFVNDFAARIALNMIWTLLRKGRLDYNVVYYNLTQMKMLRAWKGVNA